MWATFVEGATVDCKLDGQAQQALSVDLHGSDGHRSPVAERLASDVTTQGSAHPLVRAQVANALAAAVLGVSVAVGRTGDTLAWAHVPPGGGVVPDEVWLDTGKTPYQVAAGL